MLIKIEAIIREEKFEEVKDALNQIVEVQMQPKIKFEIVVSSEEWEQKVIDTICKSAYTGEVGDGKIFSYEIRSARKIRTGETGYDAIQMTSESSGEEA